MKRKILVVDDDRVLRYMLQRYLERAGLEVCTASDGQKGVETFLKERPQLVILDYRMPRLNGIEVLELLTREGLESHSVIMLAGNEDQTVIEQCYELGVHAYMLKPVNLLTLKGMVLRAFELLNYSLNLKQLIEARERAFNMLQTTIDNIDEGVITLNTHFEVAMISARACDILEIDREDATGRSVSYILGDGFISGDSPFMNSVKHHAKSENIQMRLDGKDGSIKTVALSISPVSYEVNHHGWILLLRDLFEIRTTNEMRFGGFVSGDPRMKEVFELITKTADSTVPVLIEGESGTGKELVAREIHKRGPRRLKSFMAVNCAAIPPQLLESEFFGHEKGSFTGADQTKRGRFEMADGGTLFLDEIGEMPIEMQGKLLRALQEKKFERVGGTRTIEVDVRILAATNRDLKAMTRENTFREDLFYRLRVIPITLPPLRERILDVPHLVTYYIDDLNKRENRKIKFMAPDALQRLMEYAWPGNIRELVNVLEYCFVVCSGSIIQLKHLPKELQHAFDNRGPTAGVPQGEKEFLLQTLQSVNFRKGKAAEKLGIDPSTLYRKMKKYGIS